MERHLPVPTSSSASGFLVWLLLVAIVSTKWLGKDPMRLDIDRKEVIDERLSLFDNTVKTVVFTDVFRDFRATDKVEQIKLDFTADIVS